MTMVGIAVSKKILNPCDDITFYHNVVSGSNDENIKLPRKVVAASLHSRTAAAHDVLGPRFFRSWHLFCKAFYSKRS